MTSPAIGAQTHQHEAAAAEPERRAAHDRAANPDLLPRCRLLSCSLHRVNFSDRPPNVHSTLAVASWVAAEMHRRDARPPYSRAAEKTSFLGNLRAYSPRTSTRTAKTQRCRVSAGGDCQSLLRPSK